MDTESPVLRLRKTKVSQKFNLGPNVNYKLVVIKIDDLTDLDRIIDSQF